MCRGSCAGRQTGCLADRRGGVGFAASLLVHEMDAYIYICVYVSIVVYQKCEMQYTSSTCTQEQML